MGFAIGYTLIALCCFYLIRNVWAGFFLYPIANSINQCWTEPGKIHKEKVKKMELRNYYLFVLNPFWWSLVPVFKRKEDRQTIVEIKKIIKEFYSSLQR